MLGGLKLSALRDDGDDHTNMSLGIVPDHDALRSSHLEIEGSYSFEFRPHGLRYSSLSKSANCLQ
jgi:hypothetical protein